MSELEKLLLSILVTIGIFVIFLWLTKDSRKKWIEEIKERKKRMKIEGESRKKEEKGNDIIDTILNIISGVVFIIVIYKIILPWWIKIFTPVVNSSFLSNTEGLGGILAFILVIVVFTIMLVSILLICIWFVLSIELIFGGKKIFGR